MNDSPRLSEYDHSAIWFNRLWNIQWGKCSVNSKIQEHNHVYEWSEQIQAIARD
ncbi:MAG: hypothetical protein ACREPR_25425 [Brasilonema sp.]